MSPTNTRIVEPAATTRIWTGTPACTASLASASRVQWLSSALTFAEEDPPVARADTDVVAIEGVVADARPGDAEDQAGVAG